MTQDIKITAKKLRTELNTTFDNCKFAVSCKKFSIGQSIYISWENGVSEMDVEVLINKVEEDYNVQGIQIRNERSTFIFTYRKVSEENREAVKISVLEELIESPVEGLGEWDFERMCNGRVAATTFF